MSKVRKYKKGSIYEITFYDHAISEKYEDVICSAVGYFDSEDLNFIRLAFWNTHTHSFKHCREISNIIKSTIISSRKLT